MTRSQSVHTQSVPVHPYTVHGFGGPVDSSSGRGVQRGYRELETNDKYIYINTLQAFQEGHTDRIVSENANSTRDAPGRTSDGDGLTNDRLRATLESHRRELDLSAVSHQAARTESQGTRDLAPRQSREAKPPRKEYERDPKDPRPPERPSITTLSQKRSYGPQSFSRDDMIDKAKHARQQPSITTGGGRGLPMPAHAPTPAGGYAAAQDRARAAQAHAR